MIKRGYLDKARIDEHVQHLLHTSFQDHPPINLEEIALRLELKINSDASLFPSPGKIERIEGGYSISFNPFDPYTRQRFTIAHEIAHYVLHSDYIGGGIIDDPLYRSGLPSLQEAEANRFAAQLLMPLEMIKTSARGWIAKFHEDYERIASNMANEFNVSLAAMRIRLGLH